MASVKSRVIVGDIGGTSARFAFVADGRLGPIESMAVAEYPDFTAALRAFLDRRRDQTSICGAIFAAAGPAEGDHCVLTNSGWVIDAAQLRSGFGLQHVRIINDFEATAWALPQLTSADLFAIGGGKPFVDEPAVVLGPGTGFGLACLVPGSQGATVIGTECGHATLPSTSRREDAVIDLLRHQFGHVSIERALSGEGLCNLYHALGSVDALSALPRTAAEIVNAALDGSCPASRAALDMFCALLGTVAGDAVLTFGARGGLYIAGGIVPRITAYLRRSEFRARFEAKGRFRNYLAAVRASVITHADPTFLGLRWLAKQSPLCDAPGSDGVALFAKA